MSVPISIVSFTAAGAEAASRVKNALEQQGYEVKAWAKRAAQKDVYHLEENLQQWTAREFKEARGLVFIGAAGIAVRAIAPHIKSKTTDPAVVVVDERGRFSISLLSGHLGGANQLAQHIAQGIGATAVVTTATDINDKFAVDQWAKDNGCAITHMKIAREISAAILEGEAVEFFCDYPIYGIIPAELQHPSDRLRIAVSIRRRGGILEPDQMNSASPVQKQVLQLVPRIITLGIGCRRGMPREKLEAFAEAILERENIRWEAVCRISSIDLKQDEQGLLELAERHSLALTTYSAEQLNAVEGDFTPSDFVSSVTGVDNVCERAAVCQDQGSLLVKKEARDGMTIAVSCREFFAYFAAAPSYEEK